MTSFLVSKQIISSYGFIITRHVKCQKTNKYWNHCVRCIRFYYPFRKIIIIDDNSKDEFVKSDFDYKKDFGGVIYLFVRGVRENGSGGIFFCKPKLDLVENISALLSK
jgi:hypothetical protein